MTELLKPKESLMKLLLSAPSHSSLMATAPIACSSLGQVNILSSLPNVASTMTDVSDDSSTKLISYFHQFSTTGEKETDPVLMDHCYSRPWNWRPETSFIRPSKTLFISKINNSKQKSVRDNSSNIDVISVAPTPTPIYDVEKAKGLMDECERHAAFARIDEGNENWEETISKVNWTASQNRLYASMVKILNSDRMARLAYSGSWNEPVLRRAVIDKSVQRTRALMAGISWDVRLTQWLHTLLIDNLSTSYLAAYLDILQTLKSKLPTFVEKMMLGPSSSSRVGVTSNESLYPLLRRAWDPVASSLMQDKPKKLPGNPVFIIAPSSASTGSNFSKRLHKWTNLLTSLAHVITVNAHVGPAGKGTNMTNCADQMLASVRSKMQEVRNDCPNRPIILVGFNTGAALVCQVAEVEHVVAVVCVGFPLLTTEGRRGEPDDILLEMQCPVMFVIGQNSHKTSREDMEDLRERMRVETGLVVVGSADDCLRMCKHKKRAEGITQSIVDRCVLDEIGDFVGSILLAPYPSAGRHPPIYSGPTQFMNEHVTNKRIKVERIRSNSNGSSIESEPPSPQPPKLVRPAGRPPGSGKKKNLLHHFQGTLPSSKSPINTPLSSPRNTPHSSPTSMHNSSHNMITGNLSRMQTTDQSNISNDSVPNHTGMSFVHKPDVFRASTTPDALNTAIQSIIPVASIQPPLTSVPQLQAMGVISSRSILTSGNTLSNLLQKENTTTSSSGMRTITTTSGGTIKVLENIPIASGTKVISTSGRTVDLSKVTLVNTATGSGNKATNLGSVVLLSDGTKCIRNTNNAGMLQSVKTIGSSAMMLPVLPNRGQGQLQLQKTISHNTGITKLVPTRRQVITKQRPQPVNNLPAPNNLTTADILDLPIIFADNDSTLLTSSNLDEGSNTQVVVTQRKPSTSKYVVINKQTVIPSSSSGNIQQNILKRAATNQTMRSVGHHTKYARIIINQNQLQDSDEMKPHILITSQKIKSNDQCSSDQISASPKKIDTCSALDLIDLESELKASTVPKPTQTSVIHAQTIKNKQEMKHFTTASRNVTLRVPISVTRTMTHTPSRFITTDSNSSGENIQFVLNHSVANRNKRSMKSPEQFMKHRNVSYRIENIYEDESLDDPSELDK